MDKQSNPLIIAMKGHPGTGKSTLATTIATTLKCPLLDKDDIRDATYTLQQSPTCTEPSLLNDLAYSVLWRIAETQLRVGVPIIVVDSPLSRRAHLNKLHDLAVRYGGRVVVVECRSGDEVEWRRRLEARGGTIVASGGDGWHKPSTWEELQRLLDGYKGCTEYDMDGVMRIVVDTTGVVRTEDVLQFIRDC